MSSFQIKSWNAWAPGVDTKELWTAWSLGQLDIELVKKGPGLKHLPPTSRRRLSQVTKMVLEVGHSLVDELDNPSVVLSSQYGEITQQNKISRGILEDGEVKPSGFSLSVFNTPISLLSIHETITEPAIVILSGADVLYTGLLTLISELNSSPNKDVLLIFADELLPEDYSSIASDIEPYCLGLLVGSGHGSSGININQSSSKASDEDIKYPLDLLKWILSEEKSVKVRLDGMVIELSKC